MEMEVPEPRKPPGKLERLFFGADNCKKCPEWTNVLKINDFAFMRHNVPWGPSSVQEGHVGRPRSCFFT